MSPSKKESPYSAWSELVKAAEGFLAMRPWEVLNENDIFGVLDPEQGQILYCTVLGKLGEVFGIAVYPGQSGWHCYLKMRDPGYVGIEPRLYLDSLLISFEERELLTKEDVRLLKGLKRSYRKARWPQFRCYRLGYMEHLPQDRERRQMTIALQGATVMTDWQGKGQAPQVETGRLGLLYYDLKAGQWDWSEAEFDMAKAYHLAEPPLDEIRLQSLKRQTSVGGVWEGSVYLLPMPVEQKAGTGYFPCIGLWTDHHSYYALGQELRPPENVPAALVESLFQSMESVGQIPKVLRVDRSCYLEVLKRVSNHLGIRVEQVDSLPAMHNLIENMESELLNGSRMLPAVDKDAHEFSQGANAPFGRLSGENQFLFEEFVLWLFEKGLSEATVSKHLDTVHIYTQLFLSRIKGGSVQAQDGGLYLDLFFREWLPAFDPRLSPNKVSRTIAGLKKFYTFLEDYGYLDKEDLKKFRQTISDNKEKWKELTE